MQTILDDAVGVVGHLQVRMPVRRERKIHNRLRISFRLGDDRLLDLVGQPAAHTPDPVADIGSSCILIAIQLELNDDETSLLPSD